MTEYYLADETRLELSGCKLSDTKLRLCCANMATLSSLFILRAYLIRPLDHSGKWRLL